MVSYGKMYPSYRCGGRFYGRRVNCEQVPLLPGWIVGRVLDDPRRIPYLLAWRSRSDYTVQEAVRISPYSELPGPFLLDWTGCVEIKRYDKTRTLVRTVLRSVARKGAKCRLLVCPGCQMPRRALYGWRPGGQYTTSVITSQWECRTCLGLRYASEGGALVIRGRGRFFKMIEMQFGTSRSPRPDLWYPEIYNSREQMAEAGFCE